MAKLGLLFVCFAATLTCAGCRGSESPDLAQVTGVVKMDGKPLANVMVTFRPDNGRGSSGTTDESGKYELFYTSETPGALVGKHKVYITNVVDDAAAEFVDDSVKGKDKGKDKGKVKGKVKGKDKGKVKGKDNSQGDHEVAAPTSRKTIPARYNSKSELTRDVAAGKNIIDFVDLKSD